MYLVHTKYKTMEGEPHLGYQVESDLIEADGEAEELFLQKVVDDQCPCQYFTAIDFISGDDIDLDITDYVGQSVYDTFESSIMHTDEDKELTFEKVESTWLAVLAHDARMRRRRL